MIYYVDSENGNNENDGLSGTTAWRTLSKLNEHNFSRGDEIRLSPTGHILHKNLEIKCDNLTFSSMTDEEAAIQIDGWREAWRNRDSWRPKGER